MGWENSTSYLGGNRNMSDECIKDFAREIMRRIVHKGINDILAEMHGMAIDTKKFHIGVVITPIEGNEALDCSTVAVNNFGLDCISGDTILNIHTLGALACDGSTKELLSGLVRGLGELQLTMDAAYGMADAALTDFKDQPPPQEAN
jgi:hypothetical protein